MIVVEDLRAGYEGVEVLKDVSLRVEGGQILALLGRNGAGKTTLLRTMMGYLKPLSGRTVLLGVDVTGWDPHRVAELGVAYVPQDGAVFQRLTVEENLRLSRRGRLGAEVAAEAFRLMPELVALRSRRAGELSGGEQRILAVARALALAPRVLLLDEPTTGLMPPVARRVMALLSGLKEGGAAMLVVEQSPLVVLGVADRIALMEAGRISWIVSREEARERPELLSRALGLTR